MLRLKKAEGRRQKAEGRRQKEGESDPCFCSALKIACAFGIGINP
jgi:hypothetical protein